MGCKKANSAVKSIRNWSKDLGKFNHSVCTAGINQDYQSSQSGLSAAVVPTITDTAQSSTVLL